MALGEHWGGVAKGVEDVVFVKIGTGIGSGIIIGGRIHRGTQGCAGDFRPYLCRPERAHLLVWQHRLPGSDGCGPCHGAAGGEMRQGGRVPSSRRDSD